MDAALYLFESGPAAGAFAFAIASLAGAGHAAYRMVALIVQWIVRDFVLADVLPDGVPRPPGHRI